MNVLQIDSSILGDHSASRALTAQIVARVRRENPGATVTYRDLAAQELPHFSGRSLQGEAGEAERNARTLAEFQAADVLVIGAPMYNFSIPSQLKAWIDRILVAGKTFRYTASGPQGLAGGKRVIVAAAKGGVYGANAPGEFVETYLRHVLGFIGITDVTFVSAEGLAISADRRRASIDSALAAIARAPAGGVRIQDNLRSAI
jgi:FMN-dependent NADH-azoreductase